MLPPESKYGKEPCRVQQVYYSNSPGSEHLQNASRLHQPNVTGSEARALTGTLTLALVLLGQCLPNIGLLVLVQGLSALLGHQLNSAGA